MKKRKTWLYIIYAIIAIVAVIIALVFVPKKDDLDSNPIEEQEETSSGEKDNNNSTEEDSADDDASTNEPETEQPKVKISLYIPDSINLLVGASIHFSSGYISVEPSERLNDMKIEIEPRYNSDPFGLTDSNGNFIANSVGSYNINFRIGDTKKSTTVFVYEDKTNSHLIQTLTSLENNKQYNINELFSLNSESEYIVQTDDKMSFNETSFSTLQTGISNISIGFKESYITYTYNFEFTIKDQPEFSIIVESSNIEIILNDNDAKQFSYVVKDKNNKEAYQLVDATSSDESIVKVERVTDFLIKLRAEKTGSAKIKVFLKKDPSIFIEININVN